MAETRPLKLPATFSHFDIYHIPLFSCKPVLMGRLNAPKSGLSNGRLRFMYENLAKIVIYLFNYLKFSRVVANTKLLVIAGCHSSAISLDSPLLPLVNSCETTRKP